VSEAEVRNISTLVKQRKNPFDSSARTATDLVEKEEAELQILLAYLPQPFSQTEIEALIDRVIGETQATGPRDHGKVMKAVMTQVAGRADGKAVSESVKQKLSQLAS
jgi:uncharacterized protein YqeY